MPSFGDDNADFTYAGVGRVLSQWEQVEIELGYLYSALQGKPQDWETAIEYGQGSAFKGRMQILDKAAKSFFIKFNNQTIEANFESLCEKVNAFADRRNDVAHSIVRTEEFASWRIHGQPDPYSQGRRYFLLPSQYKGKSFNENALPEYAYTYETLKQLDHQLTLLYMEVNGFAHTIAKLMHSAP